HDTIFLSMNDTTNRMLSMEVTWVLSFFSFVYTNSYSYPCALIHWFDHIADEHDELTGMWMVKPSFIMDGMKNLSVIHVGSIIHTAHLLPIFGHEPSNSLDTNGCFYVNHFSDHHTFELAS
ncbi:hypothetical protein EDC04DRAFT_2581487, partial [Pisolithus marmoratus]